MPGSCEAWRAEGMCAPSLHLAMQAASVLSGPFCSEVKLPHIQPRNYAPGSTRHSAYMIALDPTAVHGAGTVVSMLSIGPTYCTASRWRCRQSKPGLAACKACWECQRSWSRAGDGLASTLVPPLPLIPDGSHCLKVSSLARFCVLTSTVT